MRTLYRSYLKQAIKLNDYIYRLKTELADTHDVDKRKSLEKRIEVLRTEYYELIRDARAISGYLGSDYREPQDDMYGDATC